MRNGRINRYPGNGPFRDLPPFQRPGYLYGGVRGYRGKDPTKCARLPWLQRWWWSNPENEETTINPTTEKEYLETQLGYLDKEIEHIKSRLEEIGETENQ